MAPSKPQKTVFKCTACGHETPRWAGQCSGCQDWNTLEEVPQSLLAGSSKRPARSAHHQSARPQPAALRNASATEAVRLSSGIPEFDFVLGGGIVPGSIVLLGGDPGIGKSTLVMQVAGGLDAAGHRVLYSAGEENATQVQARARRLGGRCEDVCFVGESNLDLVLEHALTLQPEVLIVDSIQTLVADACDGGPGSVSQLRECATQLQRFAKDHQIAVLLIGHVVKGGEIAGPKTLEHIVDAVLMFSHVGDGEHRLIRATKNRFGSVDELAVFRMSAQGLIAVSNPSEIFLADRAAHAAGSTVVAAIEGSRPILVEVQGLATTSTYGSPQRVTTGFSRKRLAILVAVLEKRIGLPCGTFDVFVNVVGGLQMTEPAADAAVCLAIASSVVNRPVPASVCVLGEVGLSGEIRRVRQIERRILEAATHGFSTIYVPARALPRTTPAGCTLVPITDLADLLQRVLQMTPAPVVTPTVAHSSAGGRRDPRERTADARRTPLAVPRT